MAKLKVFDDHIATAPRSAIYRPKTTQNAIINICGKMIKEHLINDIKAAKFFSVLANEAICVSNLEQISVVLRFVDQSSLVCEEFLGFVVCDEGLKGEAITKKILKTWVLTWVTVAVKVMLGQQICLESAFELLP